MPKLFPYRAFNQGIADYKNGGRKKKYHNPELKEQYEKGYNVGHLYPGKICPNNQSYAECVLGQSK